VTLPQHIAIVMDGNGRWAEARGEPRTFGHRAGVDAVRTCVRACAARNIGALTLFAFSSENWRRPEVEVAALMSLFVEALDRELEELQRNRVRLRFIGNRQTLAVRLQQRIAAAEAATADNDGLKLQVAVGYGGRWDLIEAARRIAARCASGALRADEIDEGMFADELQLAGLPDPDLFVRTGGEHRISNFLLWNIAYAELHFTDRLWPDFSEQDLDAAIADFAGRERRFGRTGAQTRKGSA
jgi:undecaprenyl diphosphate synthase